MVVGGQGGCEPRIEVIVKMHKKKSGGGSGWGGSEWWCTKNWKLLRNALKMLGEVGPVGGGGGGRLVRVVLNEELKLLWKCQKSRGGQGGCERRIEVIVTMH